MMAAVSPARQSGIRFISAGAVGQRGMRWYQKSNHGGLYEHSICIAVIAETFESCLCCHPPAHVHHLAASPRALGPNASFCPRVFFFVRAADSCVCVCVGRGSFEIACATVDPQTASFDPSPLIPYLESLGVTLHYLSSPIIELAKTAMQGDSLCAFCARYYWWWR